MGYCQLGLCTTKIFKDLNNKLSWTLLISGTLVMMVILQQTGKHLINPFTPLGIINLELAPSKTSVKNILNIWSTREDGQVDQIYVAKKNTYIDFVFILFYVTLLFQTTRHYTGTFHKRSFLAGCGRILTPLPFVAGILDIFENIGILMSLNNKISSNVVHLTFTSSLLKWIIVAIVLFYLLVAITMKVFVKK